nr:hypothetical protein [Candidatus Sigynarchaeota archaeon]
MNRKNKISSGNEYKNVKMAMMAIALLSITMMWSAYRADSNKQYEKSIIVGVSRNPIVINGNAQLDAFCAGNGTDGSLAHPHVIVNMTFASESSAIQVSNTNRVLWLVNCAPAGIVLHNVTTVSVMDCNGSLSATNSTGLWVQGCILSRIILTNVSLPVIVDCNITAGDVYRLCEFYRVDHASISGMRMTGALGIHAFYLEGVTNSTWTNCTLTTFTTGFYIFSSSYNNVTNCSILDIGTIMDYFSTEPNRGHAIYESGYSTGNVFTNNNIQEHRAVMGTIVTLAIVVAAGCTAAGIAIGVARKPRSAFKKKLDAGETIIRTARARLLAGGTSENGFLALTDRKIAFTSPGHDVAAWLGQVTGATATGNTLSITTDKTSTKIDVAHALDWAEAITRKIKE